MYLTNKTHSSKALTGHSQKLTTWQAKRKSQQILKNHYHTDHTLCSQGKPHTYTHIYINTEEETLYSWPSNNARVRDADPLCSGKSTYNLQSALCKCGSSIYMVPPHLWSTSADSANPGSCSTMLFTTEKNLCMSGPAQLKPVLFKGQLHLGNQNHITK